MKHNFDFDTLMQTQKTPLSEAEVAMMWQEIAPALALKAQPSPYLKFFSRRTSLQLVALICLIVVSITSAGTYVAAEQAKPGDFLFPVERAIEDLRVALASDTRAEALRTQFAEKRLREIQALIEAELIRLHQSTSTTQIVATSSQPSRIEGTIYADVTMVRAEVDGQVLTFLTNESSTIGIVEALGTEFGWSEDIIRSRLDIDVVNRTSYPSERGVGTISNQTQVRIEQGIDALLVLLDGVQSTSTRSDILVSLATNVDNLKVKGDDDEYRFRVREDGSRVIVPETPTIISAELRDTIAEQLLNEVDVEVFSNYTVVEIDFENDQDIVFQTLARTPEAVTEEVAQRTGVRPAVIWDVLDFEFKEQSEQSDDDWDNDDNSNINESRRPSQPDEVDTVRENRGSNRVAEHMTTETSAGIKKIEVDIEDGQAEVEVEYWDDNAKVFFVPYTTSEQLIQLIANRLNLSDAEVQKNIDLDFETE